MASRCQDPGASQAGADGEGPLDGVSRRTGPTFLEVSVGRGEPRLVVASPYVDGPAVALEGRASRVPLGEVGDVYDRYYVRVLEMRESIKILRQALRDIPEGPFLNPDVKLRNFKIPQGDGYGRIETPKGELGFYLVADKNGKMPYRYHVRPPSFINLTILEDMCLGQKVADVVIILGSVDIVLGEVDR